MVYRNYFTILFFLLSIVSLSARETSSQRRTYSIQNDNVGQFNGNRIACDLENNGMIVSHRITGHSGLEWPRDNNTYAVYASGLWLAGKVNGDIRTACAEYSSERTPGPWLSDSAHYGKRLFSVYKGDLANPQANSDFQDWPTELGAPWVDVDKDGFFNPLPKGPDHPEFLGDQVIWYVSHDGDTASHNVFATDPLGIEVQTTIFGFNRTNVVGDMMFVKELIINKANHTIDSMYVGLWSDPDLGDASDDFVGCDTILGMGICYNDGKDHDYADYVDGIPAVGYDYIQGPMVPSLGDTATSFGKEYHNMKNLKMTSFVKYIGTSDPTWSDPNTAQNAFNHMKGLKYNGTPYINSETGESSIFLYYDNPNDNTGLGDGIWVDGDDHRSGDRRFIMSSGPFTMSPGDSQEVVYGIFMAADGDALDSYNKLKEVDQIAQRFYDSQFIVVPDPPAPVISATSYAEEIIITWDDVTEDYYEIDNINLLPVPVSYDTLWATILLDSISTTIDTIVIEPGDTSYVTIQDTVFYYIQEIEEIDTTFQGEPTHFAFEGYHVYQVDHPIFPTKKIKLETYDRVNGITDIYDYVFDPNWGQQVNVIVHSGDDTGIQRHYRGIKDEFIGEPFKINREYYFGVSSYVHNPYGVPKALESPLSIITVRIERPTTWDYADTLGEYNNQIYADHIEGNSTGVVRVWVIDPKALTGDNYSVTFSDELIADGDTTSVINWLLTNTTTGDVLVTGNTTLGGVDYVSGVAVGDEANPITEGFQVTVANPPNEFKDFYVTENAGGAIAGWAGASAGYNGYPGMGRDNIGNQQTNGSTWFITTSNSYLKDYEDFFPYITRYAGGYGNPVGGMQYLVPDDFEFRFTAAGGKMWEAVARVFIDVPMEIWNIGSITDPADDFQLLPMFFELDWNTDGIWNLASGDHAISGGNNDPYLEGFYVLEHMDRAPGTAGYDAMIHSLTTDPTASGDYIWASGAGYPLSGANQVTTVVMLNMTFANWNGGDVDDPTFPANIDAVMPETGTVFRITTTKPITSNDIFIFSTDSLKGKTLSFDPDRIKIWPNPYFGHNPEEDIYGGARLMFSGLPEAGECTIRIFDLAGHTVKIIDHSNMGTQHIAWDLKNNFGESVASGMYLVHIETDEGSVILKLAVIN